MLLVADEMISAVWMSISPLNKLLLCCIEAEMVTVRRLKL